MAKRIVNKYRTTCSFCGGAVAPKAGYVRRVGGRWLGAHIACLTEGKGSVTVIRTSTGTYTQNSRGRCEDAPCCGCCTI